MQKLVNRLNNDRGVHSKSLDKRPQRVVDEINNFLWEKSAFIDAWQAFARLHAWHEWRRSKRQ